MTDLASWKPFAAALRLLVERGIQEAQAKKRICDAIVDLGLRVRVEIAAHGVGGQNP